MIHILYRHTNHSGFGKNRPHWFSYEKSLDNILSTIEGFDFVKFHLMFDGECNITDPRIHYTEVFKGGSDWASYCYTWNYAKNLDLKDIITKAKNKIIEIEKELKDNPLDKKDLSKFDYNEVIKTVMDQINTDITDITDKSLKKYIQSYFNDNDFTGILAENEVFKKAFYKKLKYIFLMM
jgi:cell fate (sporulation/competence/biofilm development) regulator YmcA (YheA/YmcA/DUF963 family)